MGLGWQDLWLVLLTLQGGIPKPDPAMSGHEKGRVPHMCSYSTFTPWQAALSPHTWRRRAPLLPGPEEFSQTCSL